MADCRDTIPPAVGPVEEVSTLWVSLSHAPNLERVTAIQKTPKEIDRIDLDIEGGLLSSAALRFSRLPQEHSFATAANLRPTDNPTVSRLALSLPTPLRKVHASDQKVPPEYGRCEARTAPSKSIKEKRAPES